MGLIRFIFWFAVFVAATFAWIVLFEHGFSNFREGAKIEFEKVKQISPLEKKTDNSDKIGQ